MNKFANNLGMIYCEICGLAKDKYRLRKKCFCKGDEE
tara:strand:+ start:568 stop:678 length:111 start_codon:yes stop_codon:yes gene_type:complete